jgi:hypothetical protein
MTTNEEVLQNCTVEGTTVKLPNVQLDRKLYQEVAKALELIGGKWKGGKVFGFVFATDPTDLLEIVSVYGIGLCWGYHSAYIGFGFGIPKGYPTFKVLSLKDKT